MNKKLSCLLVMMISLGMTHAWSDESMQYNQKTLPNGDIQTSMSSSDGTKTVSLQHKDGSVETTILSSDGTKTVSTQRADGSIESKVTPPPAR
jgi:cytoskeletal protein RodZ